MLCFHLASCRGQNEQINDTTAALSRARTSTKAKQSPLFQSWLIQYQTRLQFNKQLITAYFSNEHKSYKNAQSCNVEEIEKEILNQTLHQPPHQRSGGLLWTKTHPLSKSQGNLFRRFCVIPPETIKLLDDDKTK